MSISSIAGSRLVLDASRLNGLSAISGATGTTSLASLVQSASTSSDAATLDISKPSELYAKLQKLQKEDPEKFKQVTAAIATKLQELADSKSGTDEGTKIGELAAKFKSVSEGGDITQIKPPSEMSGASGVKGAYG